VPGQFVTVKVRQAGTDPLFRIPLGVHAGTKRGIKLLYKVVGPATSILSSRKKGETLDVMGPLGNGFDTTAFSPGKKPKAVIVAGGHGVAPLYFLGQTLAKRKIEMDVFIGACEAKHIVCVKEFRKLGAKVRIAAEKGRCACKGYVTEPLEEHLENIKSGKQKSKKEKTEIFACGPRPMLAAVATEAEKHKIPAQVSLDAYMVCGIGACLGCAIETKEGYKLVCKDGPVFDARLIRWKNVC
jgi:dihydroorotate dehydrogenase electron transfer subunit